MSLTALVAQILRVKLLPLVFLWVLTNSPLSAQQEPPVEVLGTPALSVQFDMAVLSKAPKLIPTDIAPAEGVQSFFYEGAPFRGEPTRVFAYYGVPSAEPGLGAANAKYPAMVLIHGGGGTAFERWVKVWNARGYAAIAMDLCGSVPVGTYGNWQRHEAGGPPGWDASFHQTDDPIEDQWTWHAVSAVALAHSLLRSFPEVDADRIGVTGISWGGYLTSIVAGVDDRFKLAVPVYGCGFLGENSVWLPTLESLGKQKADRWLNCWDPSKYLGQVKMPMLWVNGTNDFAYPMDSWKKSYLLSASERSLCLRVRMPHGHGPAGENPEEIHFFANAILKGGNPIPRFREQVYSDGEARAAFVAHTSIAKAELCFTRQLGKWQDREWETIPADLNASESRISAKIPDGTTVFYLNLFDENDCVVSTEHVELQQNNP